MNEHRDDPPEPFEPARNLPEHEHGSYYYDDATGYEIYDPAKDVDEDVDEDAEVNDDE